MWLIFLALVGITIAGPKLVKSNSKVLNLMGKAISPVSNFFRDAGLKINGGAKKLFKTQDTDELEKLRIKIAVLEEENRKLYSTIVKSDSIKREYELLETTNRDLVPAKIVARAPGNWFDLFKINRGSHQGLKLNDTIVIAAGEEGDAIEGLVGKISEIGYDYANVTTINSEKNKVAIKNMRSGDGGIITGMKNGLLEGYMYDRNSDIIVGDTILTSGMGEVYKEGVMVGVVDRVETDESNLKKNIYIKPAVDTRNITKVFVVK